MGTPTDEVTLSELEGKAQREGVLPVIVALRVHAHPEGKLKDDERDAQRKAIAGKRDKVLEDIKGKKFSNLKSSDEVPFIALHVAPDALAALRHSPNVIGISEDREVPLEDSEFAPEPQGTSSNDIVNLSDWWDLYRINTVTAWNNGYDGRGQTVAILDDGVQSDHPALAGKVFSEGCYSTLYKGYTVGGCPNGYWYQTGPGSARPCTYNSAYCVHGTHVAATAAGIYGVAKAANIIAVQVFHRDAVTNRPTYFESDVLWGMKHVYDRRGTYSIAAVNLSLGGGFGLANGSTVPCDNVSTDAQSFYAWTQTLRSANIATVVASGNNNFYNGTTAPACISNTVSVGNTTLDIYGRDAVFGNTTGGSNSAYFVSLLAPGTHVKSAVPYGAWDYLTGTSMAAPHVTGAFAVLKQLRSWTSVSSSLAALQASGTPVTDDRNNITKPRINVWQAVIYLYNH